MKNFKKLTHRIGLVAVLVTASTASMAAGVLDATSVGTLQADITSDIAFAAGIGIALMAVTLGWDVGISLIKKFTKKGT